MRARLRAARVDRRQLVPHLALPVLRGRPGLRRPARHRGHRRDRGRRAEHGPRRRHLRRPGLHHLLAGHHQRRDPARCTPRRSASWSPGTRTIPASCCGPSPTSPSPRPRPPRTTSGRCSTLARELDPTRPVGFVNVMLAPHGKCRVSQFGDVLMLNRYYGWYVNTGDLDGRRDGLGGGAARAGRARASRSSSPSTAPTPIPACTRVTPQPWTEEYQVDYLDMNHRVFDRIDAVVGEQMWNFADFATTSGHHARRRQQEGRLHPRPPAQGRRPRPAPPLAQGRRHERMHPPPTAGRPSGSDRAAAPRAGPGAVPRATPPGTPRTTSRSR